MPDDHGNPPLRSDGGKNRVIVLCVVVGVVLFGGLTVAAYFAAVRMSELARRKITENNARQLALATENLDAAHGKMGTPYAEHPSSPLFAPRPSFTVPNDPAHRLSWRVDLLPYLERQDLHLKFDYSQPWDSPANAPAANTLVKQFHDPADPPDANTRFRAFYDNGALWDSDPKRRIALDKIPDGAANTVFFVETTDRVPWAQFNEMKFDPHGNPPALGQPAREVFAAGMADGSVRWVKKTVSPATLKAAIGRDDGTTLGSDW